MFLQFSYYFYNLVFFFCNLGNILAICYYFCNLVHIFAFQKILHFSATIGKSAVCSNHETHLGLWPIIEMVPIIAYTLHY